MPRNLDPTLLTIHKRIDTILKRVEKLDREVFKAIRMDADGVTPDPVEEQQRWQQEVAQVVVAVLRNLQANQPKPAA